MKHLSYLLICVWATMFYSCSTTSHLPEGETLYTGIRSVNYVDQGDKAIEGDSKYEGGVIVAVAGAVGAVKDAINGVSSSAKTISDAQLSKQELAEMAQGKDAAAKVLPTVKEEIEAVLAYAPNNAFFGSSYHRTPLPVGLWMYNAFGHKEKGLGHWMFKKFGSEPVLVSAVAPETRTNVAARVLRNNGFLRGTVDNSISFSKGDPRKAKINYNIHTGRIFTIDTVEFLGFAGKADSIVQAQKSKTLLKRGEPFTAANLVAEQARIADTLRNKGFYYYQASLATFKADTVAQPYKVQLRMQPSIPMGERMMHPWYIGRVYLTVLNNPLDTVSHQIQMVRSGGVYSYSGSVRPVKAGVIFRNMLHRKGRVYRAKDQEITLQLINNLGIFSHTSLDYTPRDTTATCDTLDVYFRGVLDRRYNTDLELSVVERNGDRIGPGLSVGFKKKNAFRGAEQLSFDIYGAYQWKTNLEKDQDRRLLNSYEFGSKLSLDIPRMVLPGMNPQKLRFPATTSIALDAEWLNRAGYYNMLSFGARLSYKWRKNFTSQHTLTPISLTFARLLKTSADFDSILSMNPSIAVSMEDRCVPAIEYTYAYTQSKRHRNPYTWTFTIKEAGALTSGVYALAGNSFTERDKKIFNNPYAQFLKLTTELHNDFKINATTRLVTRLGGGIVMAYGNSKVVPYSEQFYVGGANSIRAFPIRGVGPGRFVSRGGRYSFIDQTGDIKLEANAELRFAIFGALEGALFLDMGNVWLLHNDDAKEGQIKREDGKMSISNLGKDLALGTGAGVRYNLDFLVLRFDAGFALHDPASHHRGYFDTGRLSRRWAFHFAIGYPF